MLSGSDFDVILLKWSRELCVIPSYFYGTEKQSYDAIIRLSNFNTRTLWNCSNMNFRKNNNSKTINKIINKKNVYPNLIL